jgi:hypothetical protein
MTVQNSKLGRRPEIEFSIQKKADASRVMFMCLLLVFTTVCCAGRVAPSQAQSKVKIVGIGAARCAQFTSDVSANPAVRRDYLAWAQGFMSAFLLSRPPGIDERLDLTPPTFPLIKQLEFLQDYCAQHPSVDFSDAVEALYQRVRRESGS